MSVAMGFAAATLPCLLFAHWLLGRLSGGLGQRGVCALAATVIVGNTFASRALGLEAAACVYVMLASAGVAYSYFHLFNMALTARRIHLLIQRLDGAPRDHYDAAKIVGLRLERLEQMGILRREGDRITVRTGFFLAAAWLLERAYSLFY